MTPRVAAHVTVFVSEAAANMLVAGIPAAARSVMAAGEGAVIAVPGGWRPSALCRAEIARIAPGVAWSACATAELGVASPPPMDIEDLREWGRAIVRATGKPGDGIVSRYINRPISQALTRLCLRWPGMRPGHATMAAAVIGIAMLAALLLGGSAGAVAGAVLFQIASIVDGVDGEVARATHRSSARGAMLDSVTDAFTNIGFIAGLSWNLYARGQTQAAMAGTVGFLILVAGKAILALVARRQGGDFTFDSLKHHMRERPTRLKQALIWLTMRDFYALAACLMVVAGAAALLLHAFAIVAAGWFIVLCVTVTRQRWAAP